MKIRHWVLASLAVVLGVGFVLRERFTLSENRAAAHSAEKATVSTSDSRVESKLAPLSAADEWAKRWREAGSMADESSRIQAKEALIENLAVSDPLQAVELARKESDPDLRLRFLEAAMRGWGQTNPEAALAWATSQDSMDPGQAMAAVFHGAARDREGAIRLTAEMSKRAPQRANDYGSYLIAALGRSGDFGAAADFAAKGAPEARVNWLSDAYSRWANKDPRAALDYATQLTDAEARQTAWHIAVSRWAYNDPAAAAEYALDLPNQNERKFALAEALPRWAAADPVKAASWINEFEPSPELDLGAATVATRPEVIRQPELALSWAGNITDPALRGRVLASVVYGWAKVDPRAARTYAEGSPKVRPEDRAAVLAAFEQGFDPISLEP
jgi:hypothetical protein